MDQAARRVEGEKPERPENEQDDRDRQKHGMVPSKVRRRNGQITGTFRAARIKRGGFA
jgi:hypothetical protein